MAGRVEGKVALITGGASGIGRGCAEALAREGAQVVISDIQDEMGDALAKSIGEAGGKAVYLHQDVTREEEWTACVGEVDRRFGRLDILVNNAGIGLACPSIVDFTLEQWRRQQAINVEGVFLGIKHSLPLMRRGGGGSIINISSLAGLKGSAMLAGYCATKGAVRLFTKSIALECAAAKDGVRVNSVHPGIIETPIWHGISAGLGGGSGHNEGPPMTPDLDAMASVAAPLGVKGLPADIAAGVLYLACDESRYVTGSELVIDGGMNAR